MFTYAECKFSYDKVFYILILVCGVNMTYGADFFVATNGNNNASGTISNPLSSVSEAISRMSSGDSCFIRTGRYHEEIVLNSKKNPAIKDWAINLISKNS